MKLVRIGGRLLRYQGRLVRADEQEGCQFCKWWCVDMDGELVCIRSTCRPTQYTIVSGPHDSETLCRDLCDSLPWWCVPLEAGGTDCVQSATAPDGAIGPSYATEIECTEECYVPWWCVFDELGGSECMQQLTPPDPNAIGPYPSEGQCITECNRRCGIELGLCELGFGPLRCCGFWFDPCDGPTSATSCDGLETYEVNGYYMGQWDPLRGIDASGIFEEYNTPSLDAFGYGGRIVTFGLTIKDSLRPEIAGTDFPETQGATLALWGTEGINIGYDSGSLLFYFRCYGRALGAEGDCTVTPNYPDDDQWEITIPSSGLAVSGALPVRPQHDDRFEVDLLINPPSIPVGATDWQTIYRILTVRMFRGGAQVWEYTPSFADSIIERSPPLCAMAVAGCGQFIGKCPVLDGNEITFCWCYRPSACDDIEFIPNVL